MFLKLIERDRDEALRISSRTLTFADKTSRSVTTWRLVWRWYDRLLAYEFCPGEPILLADVLKHASEANLPLSDALAAVVQTYVRHIETSGGDITDDTMKMSISQ